MTTANAKRRMTAWIAIFAILLAALAPSISQAVNVARGSSANWIEICTASGFKLAKISGTQDPGSQTPGHDGTHFKRCPFCCPHAGSAGLPPSVNLALPSADGALSLPSLFYQSPQPLFTWAAAQSRAPPRRS
jgi:hypothetical protein